MRAASSYRAAGRNRNRSGNAKALKLERIVRGITRRQMDREREAERQAAIAKDREGHEP